MKKLMMAVAIVCATVAANAANVKWGSGAIQLPGEDGALNGVKLTSSSGYDLKMYAFESLSAINFAEGDIYAWYENGATGTFNGLTAINGSVSMSASATTAVATGTITPADDGTTVYGAVLFVLEKDGVAEWYMENAGEKATAKSTVTLNSLALKEGGLTTGAATSWTAAAIPEPTSGLLMLLGMAGLALRRRRA